jgi:succinate dehydrogenase / fumarate reductase membrane anchor subunit
VVEAYEIGPERWSLFLWVMQRVTGIFLVVLLFLHVIWLHFVDPLSVVSVAGVKLRLQALLFGVTDTLLLGFTVFHGMNGMRSVLYDYVGSSLGRRTISIGLMVAGSTLFVYGLWAFLPFVLGVE